MEETKQTRKWWQRWDSMPFELTAVLYALYGLGTLLPRSIVGHGANGLGVFEALCFVVFYTPWVMLALFGARAFFMRGFRLRLLWQLAFGIILISFVLYAEVLMSCDRPMRSAGDGIGTLVAIAVLLVLPVFEWLIGRACARIAAEKAVEGPAPSESVWWRIVSVVLSLVIGGIMFLVASQCLFAVGGTAQDPIRYFGWPLPYRMSSPAFSIMYSVGSMNLWRAFADFLFWVNLAYCLVRIPSTMDWFRAHRPWFHDHGWKIVAVGVPVLLLAVLFPDYTILNKYWGCLGSIRSSRLAWWEILLNFL